MQHAGGDGKNNGVIVSEGISKDVVRVEEESRIIVAWMMVKMCALYLCMGLKQGGDREKGLQGRAGENGGIGGSACGDVHSWRLQQSREKKSPSGDSAGYQGTVRNW